jgi:hypothetical protein
MKEKRLGELSEQQLEGMMDFVLSEEFDQMPASEFFATLKAMDEADLPERVVVKGHVEDGEFVPHAALGAAIEGKHIRVNKKAIIEIQIEAA